MSEHQVQASTVGRRSRTALITGASRGIGLETARRLLHEEIGRASCRERV